MRDGLQETHFQIQHVRAGSPLFGFCMKRLVMDTARSARLWVAPEYVVAVVLSTLY